MHTIETTSAAAEITLTPAQKGKVTKALKQFEGATDEQLVAFREMILMYVLSGEAIDFEAIKAEMFRRALKPEEVAAEASKSERRGKPAMTADEAQIAAVGLLGDTAKVWVATHDGKGREFPTPRVRVGIKAETESGYLIEAGYKLIGTGISFASALADTRKRVASAAAAIAKSEALREVGEEHGSMVAAEFAEELAAGQHDGAY